MNKYETEAYEDYELTNLERGCPHCGRELRVISPAADLDPRSTKPTITQALCCGKFIQMTTTRNVIIEKVDKAACDWRGRLKEENKDG